ncbi:MAG TPA: DUF1622 domain-containing protein [Longimicrobiaceae bacterium]|nr:DUF1622 domain-containing protein [Longimicrobiaceae bacterium]
MLETLEAAAHGTMRAFEVAGISVMVLGAIAATLLFLRRSLVKREFEAAYHRYRSHLGRSILLGLELMVAADIIGTVAVEPTFRSLGVLALIVVVRTFLSFSLEVEINGHWPWQASRREDHVPRDER